MEVVLIEASFMHIKATGKELLKVYQHKHKNPLVCTYCGKRLHLTSQKRINQACTVLKDEVSIEPLTLRFA